jgi:hypothetical protein
MAGTDIIQRSIDQADVPSVLRDLQQRHTELVNLAAATLTWDPELHHNRTITVNNAAGSTVTLPAASGSGARARFVIGTTITSNSFKVQVANATDVMAGVALQAADGGATLNAWEAGATDDTITMDGSTKGGIKGDIIELEDIASGLWAVSIRGAATGTEATPFSSAV